MVDISFACVNFKNKSNVEKLINYIKTYSDENHLTYDIIISSYKENTEVNKFLKSKKNKDIKTIVFEKEITQDFIKIELIRFLNSKVYIILEECICDNLDLIDRAYKEYSLGNNFVYLFDTKDKSFKSITSSIYQFVYKNFTKYVFNVKDLMANSALVAMDTEIVDILCELPYEKSVRLLSLEGLKGYKYGYILNDVKEVKNSKNFDLVSSILLCSNLVTLLTTILCFVYIKITIIPVIVFLLFILWMFFSVYIICFRELKKYKFHIDTDNKIIEKYNLNI